MLERKAFCGVMYMCARVCVWVCKIGSAGEGTE
jgi:hypothetical protein